MGPVPACLGWGAPEDKEVVIAARQLHDLAIQHKVGALRRHEAAGGLRLRPSWRRCRCCSSFDSRTLRRGSGRCCRPGVGGPCMKSMWLRRPQTSSHHGLQEQQLLGLSRPLGQRRALLPAREVAIPV